MSGMFIFGALALFILWMGKAKGFFKVIENPSIVPIRLLHVLGAFAIYLLTTFIGTFAAVSVLKEKSTVPDIGYSCWFNFLISLLTLAILGVYLKILPSPIRKGIWHRAKETFSVAADARTAFIAWVLSFPAVIFLSDLLEVFLEKVLHIKELPDQLAVYFLKSTFSSPLYFLLASLSIMALAPLIEELLFRGFLQTFIRKHLGPRQAILITSVCFALFHYASSQGYANIPILGSLFFLSLFLGFVYEKQGSFLSPVFLHSIFNTISIINLYLFGDLNIRL